MLITPLRGKITPHINLVHSDQNQKKLSYLEGSEENSMWNSRKI